MGGCVEDRRKNPVPGRDTVFRLLQNTAVACTFGSFVPGGENDPDGTREFDEYLGRFRSNVQTAGQVLYGDSCRLEKAAAKVEGDVFELLEAAALWNADAFLPAPKDCR